MNKSPNVLYICGFIGGLAIIVFTIIFIIRIIMGKKLDPSVKTVSQANKAIKYAQNLVYQLTGVWTDDYFQVKNFLKRNGLIPFNSQGKKNNKQKCACPYNEEEHRPLADYCKEHKIPTPSYGPDINFLKEDKFCDDVKGIVKRLMVINAITVTMQALALKGDVQSSKSITENIIKEKGLTDCLTDLEKEFLKSPTEEQASQLYCDPENCFTLAWALGITDEISPFHKLTQGEIKTQLEFLFRGKTVDEIVDSVKLRPEKELKFWANIYYSCLWAIRQRYFVPVLEIPEDLDREVVENRYLSLAWILSNCADEEAGEQPERWEWEDTPLDT